MAITPSVMAKVDIYLEIDKFDKLGTRKDRNKEPRWILNRFSGDNDTVIVIAKLEPSPNLNTTLKWSVEVDGKEVDLLDKENNPLPGKATTGTAKNHEVRFKISTAQAAYFKIDAQADYPGGYSTANADLEVIGDFQVSSVTYDSAKDKGTPFNEGEHFYEIVKDLSDAYRHAKKKKDPHWLDNNLDGKAVNEKGSGEQKFPVAIRRSKKGDDVFLAVAVEIAIKNKAKVDDKKEIYVRAFGPGDLELKPQKAKVKGKMIVTEMADMKPKLPNIIMYFKEAQLKWEVSFDGQNTWEYVGSNRNPFYVTWDKPANKKEGNKFELYHTYVHIGCTGGKGHGPDKPEGKGKFLSTDAIFNVRFAPRDINTHDGKKLHFYRRWLVANPAYAQWKKENKNAQNEDGAPAKTIINNINTANKLLESNDGNCFSMTDLFIKSMQSIGIDYKDEECTITASLYNPHTKKIEGVYLYTNLWTTNVQRNKNIPITVNEIQKHKLGKALLSRPIIISRYMDFSDSSNSKLFAGNKANYDYSEVVDALGAPGQNVANPMSIFTSHSVVTIAVDTNPLLTDNAASKQYEHRAWTTEGIVYDPSYGVSVRSKTAMWEYEKKMVQYYGWRWDVNVDEKDMGIDYNGDGKIGIVPHKITICETPKKSHKAADHAWRDK